MRPAAPFERHFFFGGGGSVKDGLEMRHVSSVNRLVSGFCSCAV